MTITFQSEHHINMSYPNAVVKKNSLITSDKLCSYGGSRGYIPSNEAGPPVPGVIAPALSNSQFLYLLETVSKSRRVNINLIGDSITAGMYSSNCTMSSLGKHYAGLMMQQLQALYGDGGSGYQSNNSSAFVSQAGTVLAYPLRPNTQTGTWVYYRTASCIGAATAITSVINSTTEFYFRGSDLVIYFVPQTGTNTVCTVEVNGVLIDGSCTIAANANPTMVEKVYTGVGTGGNDTVKITNITTNGQFCNIVGIGGYNNVGICINNISTPGEALASTAAPGNLNIAPAPASLGSVWLNSVGGYSYLPHMRADAVMLAIGLNDCITPVPATILDDFNGALYKFFNEIREVMPTVPIYLISMPKGINTGDRNQLYCSLRRFYQDYAFMYGCVHIDLNAIVGTSYTDLCSKGFFATFQGTTWGPSGGVGSSDILHESDAGHVILANSILNAITRLY